MYLPHYYTINRYNIIMRGRARRGIYTTLEQKTSGLVVAYVEMVYCRCQFAGGVSGKYYTTCGKLINSGDCITIEATKKQMWGGVGGSSGQFSN